MWSYSQEYHFGYHILPGKKFKFLLDTVYTQSLFSQRHSTYKLRNSEGKLTHKVNNIGSLHRTSKFTSSSLLAGVSHDEANERPLLAGKNHPTII